MSIRFSDRDMARGSDLSCYGSQRFPNITVRFGGGSRSTICILSRRTGLPKSFIIILKIDVTIKLYRWFVRKKDLWYQ